MSVFLALLISFSVHTFASAVDGCEGSLSRPPGIGGLETLRLLESFKRENVNAMAVLGQLANANGGIYELRVTPQWLQDSVGTISPWLAKKLPATYLLISNPALTKEILKLPENYLRWYKQGLKDVLGESSLFLQEDAVPADHEAWRLAHQSIIGGFTPSFINKKYLPVFAEELERMHRRWEEKKDSDHVVAEADNEVNIFAVRSGYRILTGGDLDDETARKMGPVFDKVFGAKEKGKLRAELESFLRDIVEARLKEPNADPRIIDMLIKTARAHGLGESWIYDQLITLLFASQETTRYSLALSLVELSRRPEWQRRLRQEDPEVALAFVREVLRLHAPVPSFRRYLDRSRRIGDYRIGKHTAIMVIPHAQHRNVEVWGRDALDFNPDRWLRDPAPDRSMLCAFGGGMRGCIGATLATKEIALFVASVVKTWNLLPQPRETQTSPAGAILSLTSPLDLKLERRL